MPLPRIVRNGTMTLLEYENIHHWVRYYKGAPRKCEKCGFESDNRNQFGWSNNSGKYLRDVDDWERLCVPCHVRKDEGVGNVNSNTCLRGHPLSGDNLYIKPSRGKRECKTCKRMWRDKNWRLKTPPIKTLPTTTDRSTDE